MKIFAPFTVEQAADLNRWQKLGYVHEFTCPESHEDSRVLVAVAGEGWRCPTCGYRQSWAHDYMLMLPPDPRESLR